MQTQDILANLQVKISTVRALNNVALSVDDQLINPGKHLWVSEPTEGKASVAVAFDKSHGVAKLAVELEMDDIPDGEWTLQGLGADQSILFTGKLEKSLTVIVQNELQPKRFSRLQSNSLYWQLISATEEIIGVGSTNLELYWVDIPNIDQLFRKGVPLSALQKIYNSNPLLFMFPQNGYSKLIDDEQNFQPNALGIQAVFDYNPPRYDVWRGASHFIACATFNSITVHYRAYVAAKNVAASILNCYDAAAVAQYELSLQSTATKFAYMKPFGYLMQAPLIGRGACNNPFYGDDESLKIVDRRLTTRTGFANHAFVSFNSNLNVGDACAGPHLGTETPQQYVTAAIDTVHVEPPRTATGTIANITLYTGVTAHDLIFSGIERPEFLPHYESFVNLTKIKIGSSKVTDNSGVVGKWPEPLVHPLLAHGWTPLQEELTPGEHECLKMWQLTNGKDILSVKIFVSSQGNEIALNRFLSIGSLHQNTEEIYQPGPAGIGEFSAVTKGDGPAQFFWVYKNVVCDIFTTDRSLNVLEIGKWFADFAVDNNKRDIKSFFACCQCLSLRFKIGG